MVLKKILHLVPELEQQFHKFRSIEFTNGRSQANRDQKSNLLFLQRHDQSQKFRVKKLKLKKLMIVKIFTV